MKRVYYLVSIILSCLPELNFKFVLKFCPEYRVLWYIPNSYIYMGHLDFCWAAIELVSDENEKFIEFYYNYIHKNSLYI